MQSFQSPCTFTKPAYPWLLSSHMRDQHKIERVSSKGQARLVTCTCKAWSQVTSLLHSPQRHAQRARVTPLLRRRLKTLHVHRATKKDFRAGVPVNSCSTPKTVPGCKNLGNLRNLCKQLGSALSDSTIVRCWLKFARIIKIFLHCDFCSLRSRVVTHARWGEERSLVTNDFWLHYDVFVGCDFWLHYDVFVG